MSGKTGQIPPHNFHTKPSRLRAFWCANPGGFWRARAAALPSRTAQGGVPALLSDRSAQNQNLTRSRPVESTPVLGWLQETLVLLFAPLRSYLFFRAPAFGCKESGFPERESPQRSNRRLPARPLEPSAACARANRPRNFRKRLKSVAPPIAAGANRNFSLRAA